jgi:hypothetical protein
VPGPDDDVSFQLGAVATVLSLLALWPLSDRSGRRRQDRAKRQMVWFFGALTAVVVFLMLGVSAPLWQILPLARLVQFPWRLLMLTVVSMSFLCGAAAARGAGSPEGEAAGEPGFPGAALPW